MASFDGWAHPDNIGMAAVEPYPRIGAPPRNVLTVSEVEKLAKAGVKIEFENIKDQVRSDPVSDRVLFGQIDSQGWLRDFLRRWDRTQPRAPDSQLPVRTFEHVSIFVDRPTAHVFVVLTGGRAAHLTDDAALFPSDALIAKVLLLQREGKPDV